MGYDDIGEQVVKEEKFSPMLFLESVYSVTKYKSFDEKYLDCIKFESFKKYYEFKKENDNIYGDISLESQYIFENFENMKWDYDFLKIVAIDIEVLAKDFFPNINNVPDPIISICIKNFKNGEFYILSTVANFDKEKIELEVNKEKINYIYFENEKDMLSSYIYLMKKLKPDIITGWNIDGFDIPYIYNRITLFYGEDGIKKMSPFDYVNKVNNKYFGVSYFDPGITVLDYLNLHKKFVYEKPEQYTLDVVTKKELGYGKIEYDGTLYDFFQKNPHKFIEYNIWDVELIHRLEKKMALIALGVFIAYEAKINFDSIFSTIEIWDNILYHIFRKKGVQIPPKRNRELVKKEIENKYIGAYVMEPKKGMKNWVISYDINSLYPNIIIALNLSTETCIEDFEKSDLLNKINFNLDINDFDLEKISNFLVFNNNYSKILRNNNVSLSASFNFWKKEKQSFLSEIMGELYEKRKEIRKKMHVSGTNEKNILDLKQKALKILLNSGYGAFGSVFFRYFDIRVAEAITKTAQLIIYVLKKEFEKKFKKYVDVVYGDTDSVYLSLEKFVNVLKNDHNIEKKSEIINYIKKFSTEKIEVFICEVFSRINECLNVYSDCFVMKQEVIADKGLFVAKKKYVVRSILEDGVELEEKKLKVSGIEIVRTSTPLVIRNDLKKMLEIFFEHGRDYLMDQIKKYKSEVFFKLSIEDMAFPRGASEIVKFYNEKSIYNKATPIHVRGALLYNYYLKKFKLEKKYPLLFAKSKLKFIYLKVPNPINENVISFATKLPHEFNLHKYIDYKLQFEKVFLQPLEIILNSCGMSLIKDMDKKIKTNINGFFN